MVKRLSHIALVTLVTLLLGSCVTARRDGYMGNPHVLIERRGDGERWLYYQYERKPTDSYGPCQLYQLPTLPTLPTLPPLTRRMERDPEALNLALVEHLAVMRSLYTDTTRQVRESYYRYQTECKPLQRRPIP